ncbi:MAG: hypothetical protein E7456_01960 [Ruminococcaceae bacterium]|nr:hypothetical protein [Oscillospiraceae bacterium]
MGRPKNGKILKYAALIGLVYFVFLMQAMVFPHLEILGTKPLLLPIAAVGIGLFEGHERGAVMGLVAGIYCDLSFNQPTVEFTLLLTVIGLLAGVVFNRYLDDGFPSFLVVSTLALVICAFVQMFPLWIYRDVSLLALLKTALLQTVYSLIFVLPIYHLCRLVGRIPYRRF